MPVDEFVAGRAALGSSAGVDGGHRAGAVARLVAEQEFDRVRDVLVLGEAGHLSPKVNRRGFPLNGENRTASGLSIS